MESLESATVVLQIVDATLTDDDRDRIVQKFWDDLMQLEITPRATITALPQTDPAVARWGLQVHLAEPDQIVTWVKDMSERLAVTPVEIRLTCTVDRLRVQTQTDSPEQLLAMIPALRAILPAPQLLQARAQLYAQRGGEITPVERANLELLRHDLEFPPEAMEAMIQKALGPYGDRQAKLDKYREVLSAEIERQPIPLDNTTHLELRRLYQVLGLSQADVEPINQEYIARIKAEATHLQEQERAARAQQETHRQAEVTQQQVVMRQEYAELYRQEYAAAIAHTPYPTDFDRGRLKQACADWQLDPEVVRAIEREVTDQQYGPIDSAMQLKYHRLRDLLWKAQWEAADQETERLILSAVSRDMQPINASTLAKFHCVDLQTLDALWSRYSQGRFGFIAQHRVFVQQTVQGGDFLAAIGWKSALSIGGVDVLTLRKAYRDLQFTLEAPIGHLPTWRWGATTLEGEYALDEAVVERIFHDVIEKCWPKLRSQRVTEVREGVMDAER